MYAQGSATQFIDKGVQQRGINIGWGLLWLCLGALLMLVAQQVLRGVVIVLLEVFLVMHSRY